VLSLFALQVKSSGGYLAAVSSISAGGKRCLALDTGGRLWSWGNTYNVLPNNFYTGNPGTGYVTDFSAGGDLLAMILSGIGGDLNGDSQVGLADAILGLKLLSGASVGEVRLDGAVTGEPRITLGDVLYILQRTAWLRGGD
jgi:alpha-tubulin suppressor-like RCC1 family protein